MPINYDDESTDMETKFNAGVAIALQIHNLFRLSGIYKNSGEMQACHNQLESIEIWMWGKLRGKKEAREEIDAIKKKYFENFKRYVLKKQLKKKISRELFNQVKIYLDEYEKALIFWRDRFGYGMPAKEDDEGL